MPMLTEQKARHYLYKALRKDTSIPELENWLYKYDELEELLGKSNYFKLISIDYRDKYAFEALEKIIRTIINVGALEEERIIGLLHNVLSDQHDIVSTTERIYDEYCKGYNFLGFIAITYIKHADYDELNVYGNREKMIEQLDVVCKEATRLIGFFNNREIVITSEYNYVDNRNEEDKI